MSNIRGRRALLALAAVVVLGTILPAAAGSATSWQRGQVRLPANLTAHRTGLSGTFTHVSLPSARPAGPAAALGAALRPSVRPAAPNARDRGQDDGLHLVAPPNGASIAAGSSINFQWLNQWYNTQLDGAVAILIATDPNFQNVVGSGTAPCPHGNAPTCPNSVTAPAPAAGTYYWVVGVQFGSNPVHISEVWQFTVTGSGTPPPPAPPAPGPGGGTFTDATGDGNGAPDIGTVTVSNDANGQVTMAIGVPGENDLASDEAFAIGLDTDQNGGTGSTQLDGIEFIVIVNGATKTFGVFQWNGSTFVGVPASSATVRISNGPIISVNRSDLGGAAVTGFNFWVESIKGNCSTCPYDDAPNSGTWNFKLSSGSAPAPPPAPSTPPAPLTPPAAAGVATINVIALPSQPTAGLLFRILVPSVKLSTGTAARPDSYRCAGKVNGAALRGSGTGLCTFRIPSTAGGKSFVVTVTIKYKSQSKTRTLAYKVRRS